MRSISRTFGILALCAMGIGPYASAAEKDAASLQIRQEKAVISIWDGSRLVLQYRYAGVPKKPYADRLASPAGVQVLRDAPSDHKHHHGLMYAVVVDGANFWEEHEANAGRESHQSMGDVRTLLCDGVGRAGFVEELKWLGPSDKPLLIERRTIDVFRSPDLGATLVQWRSRLQTPPGKPQSTLTGNHYHGLGMRFPASMDRGGRFVFSDASKPGEVIRGDERLTPAPWCAYIAKADGKPVTVTVFDHPNNLRDLPQSCSKAFTMNTPFAYLSATMNTWKQPIVVTPGKPLELCYGVAVWDGEVDRTTIERLYQRWLALSSEAASPASAKQ
jgi:hypothetical protein